MKKLKEKGFTLIEVVIVLAIGALIILVVIQAVSAARRSQRDNARKSEAGQIAALLDQYASNNGGVYPSNANFATFLGDYSEELDDKGYTDVASCPGTVDPEDYLVRYSRPSTHSYNLDVCLEVGGEVEVQ